MSAARDAALVAEVRCRAQAIRERIIMTAARLGEGYISQGLGAADLFACLYFSELRLRPEDPDWPQRDVCLLSTAHNSLAMYATLAEVGTLSAEQLASYGQDGSDLEMISSELVPGVEATLGSLGQGVSVGVGAALAIRRRSSDRRVYVVLGDGEMQEGQVWEAAMAGSAFALGNLCVLVDLNGMQVEGAITDVLDMGPIAAKWSAFGWHTQEIDGHDVEAILHALDAARDVAARPSAIIARTTPGQGVSFLAGQFQHYAKVLPERVDAALEEIRGNA